MNKSQNPGRRTCMAALLIATLGLSSGCGSSGAGALTAPRVAPARVFSLQSFQPTRAAAPGQPMTISFTVLQPNGKPLTAYRTGTGPHTGVHVIIVRQDLAYIIHQHPPIASDGLIRQTVTFPAPGPYKVLVDVYPNLPGGPPNFSFRGR